MAELTASESPCIWIDAISIDQSSTSERASQVSIMDRIYRQAKKVLIWLGDEDSLTKEGMDVIHLLASTNEAYQLMKPSYSIKSVADTIGTPENSPLLAQLGAPPITWRQWQAAVAFYKRSWFTRSWNVQEFAMGRDACFICGNFVMNWRVLYSATLFLYHLGWTAHAAQAELPGTYTTIYNGPPQAPLKILVETPDIFHESSMRLVGLHELQSKMALLRWSISTPTMPLQVVLGIFWATSCTSPADRVYAYLGTVPQGSWQGRSIDYTRPVETTYLQATWAMIRSTNSLRILSFLECKSARRYTDLPSWVPDYSATRLGVQLDSGCDIAFSSLVLCRFSATGGTNYGAHIDDTLSPLLKLRGYLQSTIVAVPPAQRPPVPYSFLSTL